MRARAPRERTSSRRRVERDDPAAVHDRDALAQGFGLFQVVRGQHDRAALLADRSDHVPEGAPGLWIESGGGLVEEHQLGVVHQRERDREPLLLAARELARLAVALLLEADDREHALGAPVGRLPVEPGIQIEQLARRQPLEERGRLELNADPQLHRARIGPDGHAQNLDPASVGLGQPLDHLERGRLAGAVRPEDPERLALGDLEGHALDRHRGAVGLAQLAHVDGDHVRQRYQPIDARVPRARLARVARMSRFASLLDQQVANEFAASQQYIAIAVHYDDEDLPELARRFYQQALEERNHAMMIVQYLLDQDLHVTIPGVETPQTGFGDLAAPVALALEQEKRVSEQIKSLVAAAREEGDFQGEQFLQWFLKEQVEEVSSMSTMLRQIERAGDNALWIEDYLARTPQGEGADPTAPPAAGGAL